MKRMIHEKKNINKVEMIKWNQIEFGAKNKKILFGIQKESLFSQKKESANLKKVYLILSQKEEILKK